MSLFDSKVAKLPLSSLEGEVGQPRTVDQLLYGGKLKVHENRSYCGIHNVDCSDTWWLGELAGDYLV